MKTTPQESPVNPTQATAFAANHEPDISDPPPSSRDRTDGYPPEHQPNYTIYKPTSRGSGGAVRFSLNRAKGALFVEASRQSGEKQFDWENKIIMKWGISDIGQVLATLQCRQPIAKLFHQSEKANSTFDLTLRNEPDRAPYLLNISRQDAADKSMRKVMIPVSHAEAAILETALRAAANRLLRW